MTTPIIRRRKKPIQVSTIQWTGSNEADVQNFAGGPARFYALDAEDREHSDDPDATAAVYDKLHSTWILVYTGQHIVRGVKGELYPIAEDVLTETYEERPADSHSATIYADRPCVCDESAHPTWCPASVPTDARIAEIRQGDGGPLTERELSWLRGTAGRHERHVIGARGGHWPLTDDLPGALLLVSQYLAAAVAVIERARLVEVGGAEIPEAGESS